MVSNKSFRLIAAMAAAGVALVSCTIDNFIGDGEKSLPTEGNRIITVSFSPETKTALGSDGLMPEFVGKEIVRVSNATEYQDCEVEVSKNVATFTTKLKGELRAVYPAESGKLKSNVIDDIIIPLEQDGSFARANIAEATIPENESYAIFHNRTALFAITPPEGTSFVTVKSLKPVEDGIARTGEAASINNERQDAAGRRYVTATGVDPKDGRVYISLLPGVDIKDLQIDAVSETSGKGRILGFHSDITDTAAVNTVYAIETGSWHEYVTIGGRKWATANVGASDPTGAGLHFAWGDVAGQSWNGTAWSGGGFSTAPEIGNPETLPLQYDAAYANWGGDWRMPTEAEFLALLNEEETLSLPTAGYGDNDGKKGEIEGEGHYWSSSSSGESANYLSFSNNTPHTVESGNRSVGRSVRAIIGDPSPDIKLEDLSRRIEELKGSIQSISILPAYPDGSILAKDDTLCINCAVTPAEAVMSLQESDFRILLNLAQTVQTKAGNLYVADKFTEFNKNPENGTLTIKSVVYTPPTGYTLSAALNVKIGNGGTAASSYTTDFVNVKAIFSPPQEPDPQEGELVDVDIWVNDGSLGEINWSGAYRFGLDGTDGNNECVATFDAETWATIKEGVFYAELSGPSPQIRVTTGWWGLTWTDADISPGNERLTDNGDGTWTLEINFDGNPIIDVLDVQHLMFTGQHYTVLRLYVKEYREPGVHSSEVVVWKNKDNIPVPSWGGMFRFCQDGYDSNNECFATFKEKDWNVIKEGVFRVAVEATEGSNIRVTTGWWSATYGGAEYNCINLVQEDEKGNKYIELNIKEDRNLYDLIDSQHLLFTGDGYTIQKIYYTE